MLLVHRFARLHFPYQAVWLSVDSKIRSFCGLKYCFTLSTEPLASSLSPFSSLLGTVKDPIHLSSGFSRYTRTSDPTLISFIAAAGMFVRIAVLKRSYSMTSAISLRAECITPILEICSGSSEGTTRIVQIAPNIKRVGTSPCGPAISFIAFISSMNAF